MTLIGQIERILFEQDAFFIALLKSGEKISGHYYESEISHLVGSAVTLSGMWEEHKKYGKSFKFEQIKVNQNHLFFFLTKVVKGFTKKIAAELIEHFGQEALVEILDHTPERLLEFDGIKEKRLKKIIDSWKKFRSMRKIGEFLAPYGVTPALLTTIATALKDTSDPCTKIKENPYLLTSIHGIGFKTADELALKMGVKEDDENRLQSAIEALLQEYCESMGNSCLTKTFLFEKLDALLGFRDRELLYESLLITLSAEQRVVMLSEERIAPKRIYEAEQFIYESLTARAKLQDEPFVKDLDLFLQELDLLLGEEQKSALRLINSGVKLLCLVGYAGTGKSTTSRAILKLLNTRYTKEQIITCALSGIASQRIAETTGYESATIQSLLVRFEERDTFPHAIILIDEASMINSSLFARILSKVDRAATLIIVGDDAQLPPIGAGNVLSDVLTLSLAPTIKLTKIYRQREEQAIALIANEVREARVPPYKEEYEDFRFIDLSIPNYYALKNELSTSKLSELREHNASMILSSIAHLVVESLPKARLRLQNKQIKEYLNYFQVITPMKGGTLGANNLNSVLQEYFNPNPKKCFKSGSLELRLMDKVVHTKNENMPSWSGEEFKSGIESQKRRVFNGMSGLLFRMDEEEEQLYVFYPNEDLVVLYEYEEVRSFLMLSYALTIHKVQGMEYDIVVIPMSFSHYIMHNTKLIYTALTRAKHKCIVVGESGAFEGACRRVDTTVRDTVLLELGKSKIEPQIK